MKVVVLVKEVPDTYGDRVLTLETGLADRTVGDRVLDESGERAIEAAMKVKETDVDVEVVLISMGPESASASLRKGLAVGADRAIHIQDESLRGADLSLTAEALAAAIRQVGFDLVITGNVSTDGSGGVIPAMLSEHLGAAQLTSLTSLELVGGLVSGTRATDGGTEKVSAPLPAIVSITEALPEARFPNFKGIMAAKKKTMDVKPAQFGESRVTVTKMELPPERAAGRILGDSAAAVPELIRLLQTEAKVL